MGGYGSGRPKERTTVERCIGLDVRWLVRQGSIAPGHSGITTWSRDDKELSSIGWTVRGDPVLGMSLELYYTHTPQGGRPEHVRYLVPLEYTSCHLGGQRPWFTCPGVVFGRACGRRVAFLYLRGKHFLCRHCHGVYYASQSESRCDRALSRSTKIRKRIGAQPGPAHPVLWKPRRMHWRTFERERKRLREVEDVYHEESYKQLEKLTRMLSGNKEV